jgi:hypothetical protein
MLSALNGQSGTATRLPRALRQLANLSRREVVRIANTPTKLLTQQEAHVQTLLER